MKPRTLMIMVLAITAGLGGAYFTSKRLRPAQELVQETVDDRISVLVANRDISAYTVIKAKDGETLFRIERIAKRDLPRNPVADHTKLAGKQIKSMIRKDEPLTEADLGQDERLFVAQRLRDGERAFTLVVNTETSAAGSLRPGDFVDVNVAGKAQPINGGVTVPYSGTLLQDIEVLAIESQLDPIDNATPKKIDNVTLRVTPDEVNLLTLFVDTKTGTARCVPRKPGDHTKLTLPNPMDFLVTANGAHKKQDPQVADAKPVIAPPPLPQAPQVEEKPVVEKPPVAVVVKKVEDHIMRIINDHKVAEYKFARSPEPEKSDKGKDEEKKD